MEDIVFDTNDFLILEFADLANDLRPLEIVFDSSSVIIENPTVPGGGGGSPIIINNEIVTVFMN